MDLLSSILDSMDKPPTASEQQKKVLKKQKELAENLKNKQKEELLRFRKYVEGRIERFSKDDRTSIEFQALDQLHRSIIRDVAEFGGFLAMSFGREEIDRYTVVYKKEHAPSEDEIYARRNGEGWNAEIAKEYADRRKENEMKRLERAALENNKDGASSSSTTSNECRKPNSNYKDKYAHIIGQEAALEAARKTETNLNYGFVPSKNKKDMRSIEQTLADIQAKKRLRLQQEQEQQEQQQQQEDEEEEDEDDDEENV